MKSVQHVLERNERALPASPRQADEAVKLLRNGQQGIHDAAILAALQLQADEEAAVGDERKRDAPDRWRSA